MASSNALSQYHDLLRNDFYAFIEGAFDVLNPNYRFCRNWHIELLATKLEAVRQGKIRRLALAVPPRSLKSHCASVAYPAWLLGHNPGARILCTSYGQELTEKNARDSRSLMASDFFKNIFPTRLSEQKQAVAEFETTEMGYRLSCSIGGGITGRGGDILIIDDPLKPDQALSEPLRRAVNDWYDNTLYSRQNNKTTSAIILIQQRLHEDDLIGHVLQQEPWEVVSLPAIAETAENYLIDTPYGPYKFHRGVGDVLHPTYEPRETLEQIRRTLGEYQFSSQYQQTPTPPEGLMIKEKYFRRYSPETLPNRFDQIVQSWDTASKVTELSDYSVCTTWGVKDRHYYLLHVFRQKLEFPALKRMVVELAHLHKATVVLIEDKASGTQLTQELRFEGLYTVTACQPEGDKLMRLYAHSATIENGAVHVPNEASWLAVYLHELTTFPNARHDDQADSTAQALSWLKRPIPGQGIFDYYRHLADEAQGKSTRLVRIKGPSGVSHAGLLDGSMIMVGADGTIAVSESNAGPLIGAGWTRVE